MPYNVSTPLLTHVEMSLPLFPSILGGRDSRHVPSKIKTAEAEYAGIQRSLSILRAEMAGDTALRTRT